MNNEQGHPIRVVTRRTGLTSHVIRVWEKRHGAVTPARTPTNRRLYSDADIERLLLLKRATHTVHSIGQIARLPIERLRALIAADEAIASSTPKRDELPHEHVSPPSILDACLNAVEHMEAATLEEILMRATVSLSQPVLIEQVIVPLLYRIGDLWHEGTLRVAHEHLTSAVVRTLLGSISRGLPPTDPAPGLVVTTPSGHLHELGALIVATIAASEGWRVTYLGPALPAEEIAGAVNQIRARAVALSIIYPADDPYLRGELITLRRGVADEVSIFVGGQAAEAYQAALNEIGAVWITNLTDLRKQLEFLRLRPPHPPQTS